MDRKFKVKNPGCEFCRYYLAPFPASGKMTIPACLKGARKMFSQKKTDDGKRVWKWSDCLYATEKNKDRLCPDFRIDSVVKKASNKISLKVMSAGKQLAPTFRKEKWWKT